MSESDIDYNDTSTAFTGTVVDYDLEDRIVRINDMSLMNDPEDVLRYIHVPEGVNIFSLLNLNQPNNTINISNWKVGISTRHQYYPNITAVLDVSLILNILYIMMINFQKKDLIIRNVMSNQKNRKSENFDGIHQDTK